MRCELWCGLLWDWRRCTNRALLLLRCGWTRGGRWCRRRRDARSDGCRTNGLWSGCVWLARAGLRRARGTSWRCLLTWLSCRWGWVGRARRLARSFERRLIGYIPLALLIWCGLRLAALRCRGSGRCSHAMRTWRCRRFLRGECGRDRGLYQALRYATARIGLRDDCGRSIRVGAADARKGAWLQIGDRRLGCARTRELLPWHGHGRAAPVPRA